MILLLALVPYAFVVGWIARGIIRSVNHLDERLRQ